MIPCWVRRGITLMNLEGWIRGTCIVKTTIQTVGLIYVQAGLINSPPFVQNSKCWCLCHEENHFMALELDGSDVILHLRLIQVLMKIYKRALVVLLCPSPAAATSQRTTAPSSFDFRTSLPNTAKCYSATPSVFIVIAVCVCLSSRVLLFTCCI